MEKIYTSESVTEGHPDKVCDQISDALLDAYLAEDPESRVAVETLATTDTIIIAGEVTSNASVDAEQVARKTLQKIGYTDVAFGMDSKTAQVTVLLHKQSPEISQGITEGQGEDTSQGAGDQGMMFGYASDETEEKMPMPIMLAHKLTQKLAHVRKSGEIPHLGPDGKSQVSIRYVNNVPTNITAVVIAQQHTKDISEDDLRAQIREKVIDPVCGDMMTEDTRIHINGTGAFLIGGPAVDTGLTGRKIIVDTYGGIGRHGGGAFSGKDPSKVDRSAAYMARHLAKNVVLHGLASRCEVQLSYCIGVAEPTSIYVDSFGTGNDEDIAAWIAEHFDLTPKGIIDHLGLKRPIYEETARYGHFGRDMFPWEIKHTTDK
ncbi:MAG: methionine adenosyltransferase [Nanoarchaeota archaeon]